MSTGTPTRAALTTGLGEPLVVEEVCMRAPGPGEVQVRLHAAAMCITDVLAVNGFTFAPPPFITGHAAAGIVEEVGPGVNRVRVGQRVVVVGSAECGACYACLRGTPSACDAILGGMFPPREVATRADGTTVVADGGVGTMAERMIHREVSLVPVESDLPAEHLCLLGCGVMSGLGAVLSVADVRPGDSVAVVGCGHLGLWMVQAARLAGARQIIAVEPLVERRKLAGTLGATDLVDPAQGDPVEQVKALTAGRGTDVALEAGGTTAAMEESFRMARAGGVVVPTSMDQPDSTVTLSAIDYAISGKRVLSSQTGGGHVRRDVPRFTALLESGAVDATPIVSRHFALDDINDAIAAAKSKEVLTGVIRLT